MVSITLRTLRHMDTASQAARCPRAAEDLGAAGWPRPRHEWRAARSVNRCPELPARLPVPWINGPRVQADGDWHGFRVDALRAHHERLCVVCGLPLSQRILLGAMRGEQITAGPGGHPRCILLAINTCPHLVELDWDDVTVAWEYIGAGVGYLLDDVDDVEENYGAGEVIVGDARPLTRKQAVEIARLDPLGETAVVMAGR